MDIKQPIFLILALIVTGAVLAFYLQGLSARGAISKTLPNGNPNSEGINKHVLDSLIKQARETNTSALVVLKNGKLVYESYFGKKHRPISAMSITKSVVALAIGRLIDQGKLKSLDEPVCHYYPQWAKDKRERITIRQILNHSSGLTAPQTVSDYNEQSDYIKWALDSNLDAEPGSKCVYNNKAVGVLGGIIKLVSGKETDQFVAEEIFAPMAIKQFSWSRDPAGNPGVMSGLSIHAYDLAKIGQVMLDKGSWEGKQIISQNWVEESLSPALADKRFGLCWFLLYDSTDQMIAFDSNGNLGQCLIVYPKYKLVVVRQISRERYRSENDEFQAFMSLAMALPNPD